jgi:hypothetical protein
VPRIISGQTDLDPDRDPNQRSGRDQDDDAGQGEKAELQGIEDIVPAYPGGDKIDDLPRCEDGHCCYGDEPEDVHDHRVHGANPYSPLAQWGEPPSREPVQQQAPRVGHGSEEAAALEQIEKP